MSAPAPAPALGHRRPGTRRNRPAAAGRARASTRDLPVAPRHETAVTAFHAGGHEQPTTSAARRAAEATVALLLCDWCGNSRARPSLCRCRW